MTAEPSTDAVEAKAERYRAEHDGDDDALVRINGGWYRVEDVPSLEDV